MFMDNKFNEELFSYLEEEDLTFTKEDRIATFKKIQGNNNKEKPNNNIIFIQMFKRYAGPILGTVMVLILGIGLLLPNLYSGNEIDQENPNKQLASQQTNLSFSALVMGRNSTTYRNNITILLTYNSSDKSLTLVPIPRDTYVELINSEGEMIGEDKVVHALAYESTPDLAVKTVSNLFDLSIDYYVVIPEENIYAALEVAKDDVRVNLSQTYEVGDLIKEQLSQSEIKALLKESETNIPSDILNQFQEENINSESVQVIDMAGKGITETVINSIYYVVINQTLLESTSDILKQHLSDE